jgi:hypothetical protein
VKNRVLVLLLALAGALPLSAAEILLLDSETGLGVAGTVRVADVEADVPPLAAEIDEVLSARGRSFEVTVRAQLPLAARVAVRVEAEGYEPMRSIWRANDEVVTRTVLMRPLISPPMPGSDESGAVLLSGWVSERETREPIEGAVVSASHAEVQARSDSRGYYELLLPAPALRAGRPEPVAVRVEAAGHPPQIIADQLLAAGAARLNPVLGEAAVRPGGHRQLQRRFPGPESIGIERMPSPRLGSGDAPPASITVGFADASCTQRCCTGSCPNSCTMSLEDYVRRGLPKEWIASWNFDALAAGAVAYRSYGAWHVFNPPQAAYDVCSSACCQVNEPGTQSSTNAAAAATAGLMLMQDGQIFRSEYSAQNNNLQGTLSCSNQDLSCGNGFAGSPATGWPCLADPVSVDQACFGHGRGMSQWGNQYWSQESPPRRWKRQLDHYYNDSGSGTGLRTARISQVLVIDALRIQPATIGAGGSLTLELDVRNLATEPHSDVMIGASLRQPPGPFIDDPANDQPVSLPPGPSTVRRQFVLPPGSADGVYDVYASLYLDVDRNGGISSTDLAQQLVIDAGALLVWEGIFVDRFESAAP